MQDDSRIQALEKDIQTLTIKLQETNSELATVGVRVILLENAFGTIFSKFAPEDLRKQLLTHLELTKLDLIELGLPNTPNDLRSLIAKGPSMDGPGAERKQ